MRSSFLILGPFITKIPNRDLGLGEAEEQFGLEVPEVIHAGAHARSNERDPVTFFYFEFLDGVLSNERSERQK